MKSIVRIICICSILLHAGAQSDRVFRVEARLVEVYATVLDHHGHYRDDLSADAFHVFDDGQPQTVKYFETTAQPFHCAILLDTTGSMANALPALKNAVVSFIDQFGEADSIAVYNFDERLQVQQDFTTDKAAAKRATLRLRAAGKTALFDAVAEASREISDQVGKKAIVVFTDGDDNTSVLTAQAAVDRARKNGVPLFTIAEGEAVRSGELRKILSEMSSSTGGAAFEVKSTKDMQEIFEHISADMRHVYLLGYQPHALTSDGKWHKIDVTVEGMADARIRAKQGYFPK
ncbi:MAG TPA: VWA domain-containing protein [Terracidiphilus sp.]